MSDPIKPLFFETSFQVEYADQRVDLKGLISESGITKIFITGKPPLFLEMALGHTVNVYIDVLTVRGVLGQQFVEHGSYYEIRFVELKDPQRNFIKQRIETDGKNPGWQRQFPRIPVDRSHDDPELPVANLCLIRFVGQEVFVSVLNFTLGGLRVETFGDNLSELRVGARVSFDLITNTGNIMTNFTGEVRNISTNENNADGTKVITRSFGIRMVDMHPVNERKYRDLIRDYCQALMKRFEGK